MTSSYSFFIVWRAWDNDYAIHLESRSVPHNIRPYRYPYAQKSDIKSIIQELLEVGIIQPIQSVFSTPMMMVT